MIIKYFRFLLIVAVISSYYTLQGQNVQILHRVQASSGLVSNPGADIYLGKVDYMPRVSFAQSAFRVGIEAGPYFLAKDWGLRYGANLGVRLFKFEGPISIIEFHFNAGHTWGTDDQKIYYGSLDVDISDWFGLNLTFGRDYHFDSNWITPGLYYKFSKPKGDDFFNN